MKTTRRWQCLCGAGLGLFMLGGSIGCQTNIAGMTLPSGHYLDHPPQYFAPTPPFPLSKELATMESQSASAETQAPLPPMMAPAPAAMPVPLAPPQPKPMAP